LQATRNTREKYAGARVKKILGLTVCLDSIVRFLVIAVVDLQRLSRRSVLVHDGSDGLDHAYGMRILPDISPEIYS